ncbi:MAG: hypothetical protein QW057_07195 [Candidatus Bathyarchaeia archaeon]
MRTATYLRLALLPLLLLPPLAASQAQPLFQTAFSAEVEHLARLYDGGAVLVNDTITVKNLGDAALAFIKVGLDANLSGRIDLEEAYGPQGEQLRIEHEGLATPSLYGLKVFFPQPVPPRESVTLTLRLLFSDLVSYSSAGYTVELFVHPALEVNISRLNATVILPSGVTVPSIPSGFRVATTSEGTILSLEQLEVQNYSSPVIKVGLRGDLQVLDVLSFARSIFLSGGGEVSVRDDYVLRNPISKTVSSVRLLLPRDAYAVRAEAPIGELGSSFQRGGPGGRGIVTVTLRNDLREDERASISVTYRLEAKTYLQAKASGTDYALLVDASPGLNATVKQFALKVTLPEGADLLEVSGENSSWSRGQDLFTQSVSWPSRELTPMEAPGYSITYRYSPLWAAFRPSLLGGTIIAVSLALLLSRRRMTPVVAPPAVPPTLVQAVADAAEEKLRLRSEAERLAVEFGEGRLSRRAYSERTASLSRRRAAVEKTWTERAGRLREAGERYAQLLSRIEEAEAEIEASEASVEGLTRRYRAKAISREVYERMLTDHQHRVERARATIERLIQSLRSEAKA